MEKPRRMPGLFCVWTVVSGIELRSIWGVRSRELLLPHMPAKDAVRYGAPEVAGNKEDKGGFERCLNASPVPKCEGPVAPGVVLHPR